MKRLILLLTIFPFLSCGRGRLMSIGSYPDDFSDLEFPDERGEREDCAEGTCSLYAEKRIIVPEKLVERRQSVTRLPINAPESLAQSRSICVCASQTQVDDLGEGHYPRYITTAKCKTKISANKLCQCQSYNYRVNVLVKRAVSSVLRNPKINEIDIPESLRANWQLFVMPVHVGCIAV